MITRVIGIDPGPLTGMVVLRFDDEQHWRRSVDVVQCSAGVAPALFDALLMAHAEPETTTIAIERFVVGNRAARSKSASAGKITRSLITELRGRAAAADMRGRWLERSASEVKPWASDERLAAAGLLDATRGMTHARDAARHALFAAVRDAGLPDPLSRERQRDRAIRAELAAALGQTTTYANPAEGVKRDA